MCNFTSVTTMPSVGGLSLRGLHFDCVGVWSCWLLVLMLDIDMMSCLLLLLCSVY